MAVKQWLIKEEFVYRDARWLAGDVITLSQEQVDEITEWGSEQTPPTAPVLEEIPQPAAVIAYKPTMKPIDLPSGMTPADIPYTEPPVPLPESSARKAGTTKARVDEDKASHKAAAR